MGLGEYKIARSEFNLVVVFHHTLFSEQFFFKNGWFCSLLS